MSDEKLKNPAPHIVASETVADVENAATQSAVSTVEETDQYLGQTVGHYEILSVLGTGGLGKVYKARHTLLGTLVAIKFLLPGTQLNKEAIMRFQREAQATVQLKHPFIAGLNEFGLHDAVPYLVIEYIDGKPLSSIIAEERKLEPKRGLALLTQAAEALSYAHKKNIIHRDIKPHNIIVCKNPDGSEEVKIIDFGIAKIVEEDESRNLTKTGDVFGTPNYMSPEQCQGKGTDFRSDIYSLGCLAYEMFSGTAPFSGGSALEIIMKHVSEPPPRLKVKGLKGIDKVVALTMAKDPNHRYQTMDELVNDFRLLQQSKRPQKRERATVSNRFMKRVLLGCIAVLLVFLIFYAWFLNTFYREYTIESCTAAIAKNPNDAEAYFERAKLYEKDGEWRAAIVDLNKSLEIDPKNYYAIKHRAVDYAQIGSNEEALKDATTAVNMAPKQHLAYIDRALVENELGMRKEAVADCTKSLELNPYNALNNNFPAHWQRAIAYNALREHEKAVTDIDSALALMPNPIYHVDEGTVNDYRKRCFVNRCEANLGLKRLDEAIKDANSALALDPKYTLALDWRGLVYQARGEPEKAKADFDEAILIEPDVANYYIHRAKLLMAQKDYAAARADLEAALKLDKTNPDAKELEPLLKPIKPDMG